VIARSVGIGRTAIGEYTFLGGVPKPHPEQGFRSCLGILRLEKTYGVQRLEAACRRGISIGAASYRSIASILKTGLDKAFLPETNREADPIQHGNIRGRGYYH
jgi:transposase